MEFEVSPGNVFADLGFPDAAELDIKLRLAVEIVRLINGKRLSQVAAAALLKINQLCYPTRLQPLLALDGFPRTLDE